MQFIIKLFIAGSCLYGFCKAKGQTNAMNNRPASIGIIGDTADVATVTQPGLLLAGGSTDGDTAMHWLLNKSGGGDVVIIRASGSTGYNEYLYKMGRVNSVETLLINSRELADNDTVATIVRNAEALFIAGGDQWNYTQYWKGTKLNEAINYLINTKQVPVGGTSAGLAILGEYFFDAKHGSITSDAALMNPLHEKMSINRHFIYSKWLKGMITDSHYTQRDRQGRHIAMMAKIRVEDKIRIKGLGVDEKTAVAIDGKGRMIVFGTNKAWFLQSGKKFPEIRNIENPLTWNNRGKAISYYEVTGTPTGVTIGNIKRLNRLKDGQKGFFSSIDGKMAKKLNKKN